MWDVQDEVGSCEVDGGWSVLVHQRVLCTLPYTGFMLEFMDISQVRFRNLIEGEEESSKSRYQDSYCRNHLFVEQKILGVVAAGRNIRSIQRLCGSSRHWHGIPRSRRVMKISMLLSCWSSKDTRCDGYILRGDVSVAYRTCDINRVSSSK